MNFPFAQRMERWVGRSLGYNRIKRGRNKILFILGHMRSGSSLLTHILSSNREIEGYGETHIKYEDIKDLGVCIARVCRFVGHVYINEKYVLDKVLHKWKIKDINVLKNKSTKVIFILRDPARALSSMVKKTKVVEGASDASKRYEAQVEWIERMAQEISPQEWSYTTYKEMVQKNSVVFSRLESLLELSEPLSERYETNQYTGEAGIGDPSPHIEAGHIKHNIDREVDSRVYPYLDSAEERFKSCLHVLQSESNY